MRALLKLFLFLPLAGCLAGTSSGRSTTAYVHDDGMHPVQRTTVTQTYSGSTFGASMPMVVAGNGMYGYGGGAMMGVNSGSCVLHPDNCAVIQTAPMAPPMTVVSTGGNGNGSTVGPGGAGTYGPADTSDLEARIARLETAVPKLAGAGILSLKQSCMAILKDPDMVPDDDRNAILKGCEKVLKSKTSADDVTDKGADTQAKRFVYAVCGAALDRAKEIKDRKLKGFLVDLCGTAVKDGIDSAAMLAATRRTCKSIADDPELSGDARAQEFLTECRKLDASKES